MVVLGIGKGAHAPLLAVNAGESQLLPLLTRFFEGSDMKSAEVGKLDSEQRGPLNRTQKEQPFHEDRISSKISEPPRSKEKE